MTGVLQRVVFGGLFTTARRIDICMVAKMVGCIGCPVGLIPKRNSLVLVKSTPSFSAVGHPNAFQRHYQHHHDGKGGDHDYGVRCERNGRMDE